MIYEILNGISKIHSVYVEKENCSWVRYKIANYNHTFCYEEKVLFYSKEIIVDRKKQFENCISETMKETLVPNEVGALISKLNKEEEDFEKSFNVISSIGVDQHLRNIKRLIQEYSYKDHKLLIKVSNSIGLSIDLTEGDKPQVCTGASKYSIYSELKSISDKLFEKCSEGMGVVVQYKNVQNALFEISDKEEFLKKL